jgi:signal-transduction protein with cAMP-binding, CBS, and nucleotidyltransferase domain
MGMRTKDFLASIPTFSDFSDEQLTTLEQKAEIQTFTMGEIVFRQGN